MAISRRVEYSDRIDSYTRPLRSLPTADDTPLSLRRRVTVDELRLVLPPEAVSLLRASTTRSLQRLQLFLRLVDTLLVSGSALEFSGDQGSSRVLCCSMDMVLLPFEASGGEHCTQLRCSSSSNVHACCSSPDSQCTTPLTPEKRFSLPSSAPTKLILGCFLWCWMAWMLAWTWLSSLRDFCWRAAMPSCMDWNSSESSPWGVLELSERRRKEASELLQASSLCWQTISCSRTGLLMCFCRPALILSIKIYQSCCITPVAAS